MTKKDADRRHIFNQTGVLARADEFLEMINTEKMKFKDQNLSRVFIGGFSQGGMITLSILTRYHLKEKLGGIIALSSIIPIMPDQYIPDEI